MCRHLLLLIGLSLFSLSSAASATPITYGVTVNTSSIAGTSGSLDFNFNPGPLVSQAASLQIYSFTSNGSPTGAPETIGDVSGGSLSSGLTFDNGTGFNDYFQDFTFGSSLSFQLMLYGPALSSPDGISTSGSSFAFSIFSDPAGTIPALTADTADGFAFVANVNLDGTTTISNFSPQTTVSSAVSPVPEPNYILFAGIAALLMAATKLKRPSRVS